MKRRAFLAHLRLNGCQLIREGAKHSWWGNPATGARSAVPRHTEINDYLFDSMGWIAALPCDQRVVLLDRVRSSLTSTQYLLPWETHVHWMRLRAELG